jgi:hypothetical protein
MNDNVRKDVLRAFKRALRKFENAHDAYLFRGAGDPDDEPYVVAQYKAQRAKLVEFVEELLS